MPRDDETERIDYTPTSGSGHPSDEDGYDGAGGTRNPEMHLGFNPADAEDPEKYESLAETWRNQWGDDDTGITRAQLTDVASFCTHLDCTDHQFHRVMECLEALNLRTIGSPPYEVVGLALIAHAWREDGQPIDMADHPECAEGLHERFCELCAAVDTDIAEVQSVRQSIRRNTDVL